MDTLVELEKTLKQLIFEVEHDKVDLNVCQEVINRSKPLLTKIESDFCDICNKRRQELIKLVSQTVDLAQYIVRKGRELPVSKRLGRIELWWHFRFGNPVQDINELAEFCHRFADSFDMIWCEKMLNRIVIQLEKLATIIDTKDSIISTSINVWLSSVGMWDKRHEPLWRKWMLLH